MSNSTMDNSRSNANFPKTQKDKIIKLNVGGKVYTTTRSTLTKIPNSFFHTLVEGSIPSTVDDDGNIFIDRDGTFFEPILNYLRTGTLIIPNHIPREAVLLEADFFNITPIVKLLKTEDTDSCGGRLFNGLINCRDNPNRIPLRQDSSSSLLSGPSSPTSSSTMETITNDLLHSGTPIIKIASCESEIVVLYANGIIQCYTYKLNSHWILHSSFDELAHHFNPEAEVHPNINDYEISCFSWKETGRWFLAAFAPEGKLYVWGKPLRKPGVFTVGVNTINKIFFMGHGQHVVSTSLPSATIFISSLASLNVRKLKIEQDSDTCTLISKKGYYCFGSSVYKLMIGHHENTNLQLLFTDPDGEIVTSLFHSHKNTVFYGTHRGTIRRVDGDVNTAAYRYTLVLKLHVHPITELVVFNNGSVVSACYGGHVRAWHPNDSQAIHSYSLSSPYAWGHPSQEPDLGFSSDGCVVHNDNSDDTESLKHLFLTTRLRPRRQISSLIHPPFVIDQIAEGLEIRDLLTGAKLAFVSSITESELTCFSCCFESTSETYCIITAHKDGSIQCWNIKLLLASLHAKTAACVL